MSDGFLTCASCATAHNAQAKEFGEAEVWMNERMSRVAGNHTAEFVTAFDESLSAPGGGAAAAPAGPLDNSSIWLVWKYEGDNTLMGLMEVGMG